MPGEDDCRPEQPTIDWRVSAFVFSAMVHRSASLSSDQIGQPRPHTQCPNLDFRIKLTQSCHQTFSIQRADSDSLPN